MDGTFDGGRQRQMLLAAELKGPMLDALRQLGAASTVTVLETLREQGRVGARVRVETGRRAMLQLQADELVRGLPGGSLWEAIA